MKNRHKKRDLKRQELPLVLTYQEYDEAGRREAMKNIEAWRGNRWVIAVPNSIVVSTVKRARIMDMPRFYALEARVRALEAQVKDFNKAIIL